MKSYKYFSVVIVLALLLMNCSNDDEPVGQGPTEPTVIESFEPLNIQFVYGDGSSIAADDCVNPDIAYAVEIEVTRNSDGNTDVSKIEYTINGASYSMSFSQEGTKRNPITLVDGKNIAELVKTAKSTEIMFVEQDDFKLVD